MMNRLIITILVAFCCLRGMAENHIQIVPFATEAGVTSEDCTPCSMEMVNTNAYTAMQFHLILPEGITLDMDYPFDMNPDRFPGVTRRGVFYPNHDYDITNPSPGDYFIKIYNTALETIDGSEGKILSFYYNVASDMKDGYYQILVSGAILGIDSHNGIYPQTSVSYVKVGEPGMNALLNMGNYEIPSFVAAHLPESNVIINGNCQNFVLTDGHSFSAPEDFIAANASYSRTMDTTWGTICLPYGVASDENAAYYEITGIEGDGLTLTKYDILPAGTPALVKKLSGTSISPKATSVAVTGDINNVVGSVNMFGSYTNQTRIEDPNSYYIYDNKFYSCNEYFFCNAFRAYFTTEVARAKVMHIIDDDSSVTAIEALTGHGNGVRVEAIYDENGILRNDLDKGINIVKLSDGKTQKIIIR